MSYAEELRREGRQETLLEIAKDLLKNGVDKKIIASTTHLTQDQISKLQ